MSNKQLLLSHYFSGMKAASVSEIKQALKEQKGSQLIELCLRLARFKKENKELLTYLLFEADDLALYIKNVKEEMNEEFSQVNTRNIYYAKKSLRKILRIANKHIRYTGSKTAEAEILLHYAINFKALKLPLQKSMALKKVYEGLKKKIAAAIDTMHEDLQYDYLRELEELDL